MVSLGLTRPLLLLSLMRRSLLMGGLRTIAGREGRLVGVAIFRSRCRALLLLTLVAQVAEMVGALAVGRGLRRERR